MRTGTRCTILIQLPDAFCGGSSAKALPRRRRALDMAVIGDAAAIDIGGHRHRLADAHVRELHFLEIGIDPDDCRGTTAISGVPGATCWPTCTVRWATTPSTGATASYAPA